MTPAALWAAVVIAHQVAGTAGYAARDPRPIPATFVLAFAGMLYGARAA